MFERQRRELLALRLLDALGLLLGELAQAAHELLGVAAERESEAAARLPWRPQAERSLVAPLDLAASSSTAAERLLHRRRERRARVVAERLLEPPRRGAEPVEVRRSTRAAAPARASPRARARPPRPPRSPPAPRVSRSSASRARSSSRSPPPARLLRELAERRRSTRPRARARRLATGAPASSSASQACPSSPTRTRRGRRGRRRAARRRGRRRARSPGAGERRRRARDPLEVVAQRHRPSVDSGRGEASARTRHARELFAPLGPTYDRYARAALVRAGPALAPRSSSRASRRTRRACSTSRRGTAAVAIELARAAPARTVVGVDQSPEMLAAGRARVERAGLARADRAARGARRGAAVRRRRSSTRSRSRTSCATSTTRPRRCASSRASSGRAATIAMLEFGAAARRLAAALGALRARRPARRAGALVSPAGTTSAASSARASAASTSGWPLERAARALARRRDRATCAARRLSLGGGIVVWGTRA